MELNEQYTVKDLISYLVKNAADRSNYFPVDRHFLEPLIELIFAYDPIDVIYNTVELTSGLFTTQFFLCLPELWEDVTFDKLLLICEKFEKSDSFCTVIKFTYKYLEIDILNTQFFNIIYKRKPAFLQDIRLYLQLQYNVLIKSEWEIKEYLEDEELGINYDQWLYLKQIFLLDKRIKPALKDVEVLKKHIDRLVHRI